MSKTCRDLRAFSWGKFSWTEMICENQLNTDCLPGVLSVVTCHASDSSGVEYGDNVGDRSQATYGFEKETT